MSIDGAVRIGDPNNSGTASPVPFSISGAAVTDYLSFGDLAFPLYDIGAGSLEGPLPFPAYEIDGSAITGEVGNGSSFIPSFVVSGIDIPFGNGAITLPFYDVAGGSLEPPLAFPAYTLAGTSIAGGVAAGTSVIAPFDAAGQGLTGTSSDGAAVWPFFDVSGDSGIGGDAQLVPFDLNATGVAGSVSDGALLLQSVNVAATLIQSGSGDADIALPLFIALGTASSSSVINGDATLNPVTLSANGVAGNAATASLTLPLVNLSADGFASTVGAATIVLPLLQLSGTMTQVVASPVFSSVVLNTKTRAATTYSGMPFNSLCNFNGMVLAASSAGIVALVGNDDLGLSIDAVLKSGVSDFKEQALKRVFAGYAGYRSDGNLEVTLITDEHQEFIYSLDPRRINNLHPSKFKTGRGIKGAFWQWQLANQGGADFELDSLTLDAETLSRRV